jgi:hypothetical protein
LVTVYKHLNLRRHSNNQFSFWTSLLKFVNHIKSTKRNKIGKLFWLELKSKGKFKWKINGFVSSLEILSNTLPWKIKFCFERNEQQRRYFLNYQCICLKTGYRKWGAKRKEVETRKLKIFTFMCEFWFWIIPDSDRSLLERWQESLPFRCTSEETGFNSDLEVEVRDFRRVQHACEF